MPEPKPAAFLSYVHFNDEHDDGRISRLRERLAREVQAQTGEEFPIFQDRDIEWGQEWRLRIEQALDATTFLIPVLTPSFFKSRACRDELERFLDREKKLKRQDLILPMYYIDCQLLSEPARRAADPLAEVLADRQYADWRELRHEPFTSPEVGKTLSRLAVQIRNALDRGVAPLASSHRRSATTSSKSRRRKAGEAAKPTTTTQPTTRTQEAHSGPAAKKEPPTHIVDPLYRGDFTSIGNAINAAKPGDRILVRPGLYREKLVIDKPLEILGEGERAEVVVEAEGGNVFRFETTIGRVANLTLRQVGSGNYSAVKIAQGRLDLEDCDVTSRGFVCVTVEGGADPRLRRNRIHHGAQAGILIENGRGTFEDNEIFANALAGIEVWKGGDPVFRRNLIHDGKQGGVLVDDAALGLFEDNEIFANALSGIAVKRGSDPVFRRNRIHDSKEGGVYVYDDGRGTFEENEIFSNAWAGFTVRQGGRPVVRRNHITKNGFQAVWVYEGGGGVFDGNDLRGNSRGAFDVEPDCMANTQRSGNIED